MTKLILPAGVSSRHTDPPGLVKQNGRPIGQIFNTAPDRNIGQPGITRELPQLPDDRLIATLVSLGMPRFAADEVRTHPTARFQAVAVWCLVQDAAEGKHVTHPQTGESIPAKELVDGMREAWAQARKVELISDRPEHTIGLWER